MTNNPILLDGRRTAARLLETKMRRRSANCPLPVTNHEQPHLNSLEDQTLAEPARTWGEVMKKWKFLLDRYSATPDAGNDRIQKLIRRAICDMERLRKREERDGR